MRGGLVKIQSLVPASSFNTGSALRDLFEVLYFLKKANRSFALGAFISLIHGMRNSLWNGSLPFEFHVHFYFCQSFHAAFELPFTSLSQHHTFTRLCSQFQQPECPKCCPSKYIKPDLFFH